MLRSQQDLAGVYEYDGETTYFYLYAPRHPGGARVLGAIHIHSGLAPFADGDLEIRWDRAEERVGLFIRGELWAVFDTVQDMRLGGHYLPGGSPSIPHEVTRAFGPH